MKALKLALFAACILPATLHAAEPAPENIEAAKKLTEVIGIKDQMSVGANAALDPMIDLMATQLHLDAAGKTELTAIFKEWFEKDIDHAKMLDGFVKLYAETFTAQELDQLREFYLTPVGKKSLKALPEIMQKGGQLGTEEAKSKEHLLMARLKPFIDARMAAQAGGAKPK